jgi:hypothetical protein
MWCAADVYVGVWCDVLQMFVSVRDVLQMFVSDLRLNWSGKYELPHASNKLSANREAVKVTN